MSRQGNIVIRGAAILLVGLSLQFSLFSQTEVVDGEESPAESLGVQIEQIFSEDYPNMKAYVAVEDAEKRPIPTLVRGNFTVSIDSVEQKGNFKVTGFQYTEAPVSYFVLLTVNGLLEGEPIAYQRSAVLELIDQMRDKDTLSLYLVGEQPKILFENVAKPKLDMGLITGIEVDPENVSKLYDSVAAIVPRLKQAPNERRALILYSDGRDQQSRRTHDETVRLLNQNSTSLHTIGIRILGGATLSALDRLSQSTGGRYYFSTFADKILPNTNLLVRRLMQSYVIQFKASGVRADNDYHEFVVSARDDEMRGKGSAIFIAKRVPLSLYLQIILIVLLILVIVGAVLFLLWQSKKRRVKMGITARRCPDCGSRMKDDWENCPFCAYIPNLKKRALKKKEKKKKGKVA